jgi:pyridoxine kinase
MNNIISVQSSVFNDLVGNQAARHILSNRNYNFYEIPTVILTSHKAHKNSLQLHTQNLNPWKIFSSVKKTYKLKKKDLTIVGYIPNVETSKSISKIIMDQRRILLDPVMGDVGVGLYINKEVANFFKTIISQVSYISANFFEWSYLNDKSTDSYSLNVLLKDLRKFSKKNKTTVFVRSVPYEKKILNILCKGNQVWGITTPYINFKTRFHGAGDLSTALFAHHIIQKEPLKKVLENVTKEIYSFLLTNSRGPKNKIVFKAKSLSNL